MKQSIVYTFIGVLVGIFVARSAIAQSRGESEVPRTISYQGMVSSATGAEFPSGDYAVTVRLYADEHGREVVWEGEYRTRVENGLLNLELGSGDYPLPGSSAMDRSLWIGIQVGEGPEMTPRTRLSAVPYALTVPDGSVTFDKLGVDYVSSIMIDGEKVTRKGSSLNITGGEGVDLRYDRLRGSMQIDLRRSGEDEGTRRDGEKGGSTQTPNSTVYWSEAGNRGTTPGTDYVGTSDAEELEIHVNSGNTTANAGDKRVMLYDPQPNSPNLIGGYQGNLPGRGSAIEGVTIGGGGKNNRVNEVKDDYGTIGGGAGNIAGGFGINNTDDDTYATVGGGLGNRARRDYSTVGGGRLNEAQGYISTVGGGDSNKAQGFYSTVGGGRENEAQEEYSTVGGGYQNQAQGYISTVGGGYRNEAQEEYSTVGGGRENEAQAYSSTVGGGGFNQAGYSATVGGGLGNQAQEGYSTVGGGYQNQAQGYSSTVGGGSNNRADTASAIPGGRYLTVGDNSFGFNGDSATTPTQTDISAHDRTAYFGNVDLWIGNVDSLPRQLRFYEGSSTDFDYATRNYVGFKAPHTVTTTQVYTLPDPAPAASPVLSILTGNNAGVLSWTSVLQVPNGGTGIRTTTPNGVAYGSSSGSFAFTLAGAEGQVLTSGAGGVPGWSTPSQDWALTGNGGTTPGTNYVGTSDAEELEIHVNSGNTTANAGDKRVMLYDPQPNSPNLIGGYQGNLPGRGSAIEGVTIGGGGRNNGVNEVKDDYGTIGGGAGNVAGGLITGRTNDPYATVGGGYNNQARAEYSTVGGGRQNEAQAQYSTVGGGRQNEAQEYSSTVGGGYLNQAQAYSSTVGGGLDNEAQAYSSTVGGGAVNLAQGYYSTVGGGSNNRAATASAIPGGGYLTVGDNSFGFNGDSATTPTQTDISAHNRTAYFGNVDLWIGNVDSLPRELRFYEASSTDYTYATRNYVGFKAPHTVTTTQVYTLPDPAPAASPVLSILTGNNAGVLNWTSVLQVANGGTGIGTTTPNGVAYGSSSGSFAFTAAGAEGQVLTSGAGGVPVWSTPSQDWALTGNGGTTPGTNYVGTSDAVELEIHVNSGNTTANAGDKRVMLYDPQPNSPNLIGGYQGNLPGRGSAIEGVTIGGGGRNNGVNEVKDDYGTIGGGAGNVVGGLGTTSTTDDVYATVGGGYNNQARAQYSTVGGGRENEAQGSSSTVGGGYSNEARAQYSTVGGGENNEAQGDYTTVGGGENNEAQQRYSTVGGGYSNEAQVGYSTVGGGRNNRAATASAIPGGRYLTVGDNSFGFNGDNRTIPTQTDISAHDRTAYFGNVDLWIGNVDSLPRELRFYVGNNGNFTYSGATAPLYVGFKAPQALASTRTTSTLYTLPTDFPSANGALLSSSTTGTLSWSTPSQDWALTGNGGTRPGTNYVGTSDAKELEIHVNSGNRTANAGDKRVMLYDPQPNSPNLIGGYQGNLPGRGSAIEGGTIGGGGKNNGVNEVKDDYGTIGGGSGNIAGGLITGRTNDPYATVGGGRDNQARAQYTTVGGGYSNEAQAQYSTVGGGSNNEAQADYSTVGGGYSNEAQQRYSTVGGGYSNEAQVGYSTVGGGRNNRAATASAIPGGRYLTVGDNSFGFNGDNRTIPTQTDISAHDRTAYFGNVDLWIGNVDSLPRELRFYEGNNGNFTYSGATAPLYVGFKAPQALASTRTTSTLYTLPTDFPSANGALLSSSTTGTLSWSTPSQDWALTGNGGTRPLSSGTGHYLGTSDATDLVIATASEERIGISGTTGEVTVAKGLTVDGNTTLGNDRTDAVTVNGGLSQTGGHQVSFSGNVDATNGLDVTNADLTVGGTDGTHFTVDEATGNTAIEGTLTVDGNTTLGNDRTDAVTVNGGLSQIGGHQVSFSGNVDATNGLDVTNDSLTVGGTKFTVDDVTGNTAIEGTLTVDGNTTLGNDRTDAVTVNGGLSQIGGHQVSFSGNVDATNGLDVTGALTVDTLTVNGLDVTGTLTVDTLTVNGLDVTGTLTVDTLTVSGATTLSGNLDMNGNDILDGTDGNITILEDLVVTGNVNPSDDSTYTLGTDANRWSELFVTGGSVHIGDANGDANDDEMVLGYDGTTTGTIGVNGTTSMNITTTAVNFTGNTDIDGALAVDGNTTLGDDNTADAVTVNGGLSQTGGQQVRFSGNVDATNGLDVTNADLRVGGTKFIVDDVTGNTAIEGTLTVDGDARFNGNVDATNGLDVTGGLTVDTLTVNGLDVTGGLTVDTLTVNGLNVTGALTVDTLTVSGATTLSGNLDMNGNDILDGTDGNITILEDLVVTGKVNPSANNTYTLGTDANRWSELFVTGGSVHIGDANGDANDDEMVLGYNGTTTGTIGVNGTTSMNITTTAVNFTGNTDIDGTLTVDGDARFNGNVDATNGLDVTGALTVDTLTVNGLDVTGTLTVDTLTVSGATTLSGNLDMNGNDILDGTDGNITILEDLVVTGKVNPSANNTYTLGTDANRWSELFVTGGSVHIGDANGDANDDEMVLGYDGTTTGTIGVNGTTSMNITTTDVTFTGNTDIDGTLTVDGNTTLGDENRADAVTVNGGLSQTGTQQVRFSGNVDATNGLDVTNADLRVGGTKFIVDDVTGNTDIDGTLTVDGDARFNGNVDATNGLDVTGGLTVDTITVNGLDVTGTLTVDTLTVSGATTLSGNLDMNGNDILDGTDGNITILEDLVVTGNVNPSDDSTYTLGTDANRWSELFVTGGSVHIGDANGDANDDEMVLGYDGTTTGTIGVNGTTSMNITTTDVTFTGNTDIEGTLTVDGGATVTAGGLEVSAGGAAITGNSSVTGDFNLADTVSALLLNNSAGTSGQVLVSQGGGATPIWQDVSSSTAWDLSGNSGTTSGTDYVGTIDNVALQIHVDNQGQINNPTHGRGRVMRFVPNAISANIMGGYHGNLVRTGVVGATISGGGQNGNVNDVRDNFGTIGGGSGNIAGGHRAGTTNEPYATVGGGRNNQAREQYSTVGGGQENQTQGAASAIPGGRYLTVGDNSFGYNGYNVTSNPSTTDLSSFSNIAYLGNVNFWIGNVDNTPRQLRFYVGNNGNFTYSGSTAPLYVGFKAPQALASTRTTGTLYTLPTDFPSTDGALLSSSTTGTLSWSTPSQTWALAGTMPGTGSGESYLGTADEEDLVIATNATERIRVDTDGDVGIGTNAPNVSLDVDGGFAIRPPEEITITQDNVTVDPGDRSFLRIDSDSSPANRTIVLADGDEGGQILVIQCIASARIAVSQNFMQNKIVLQQQNGIELLMSEQNHAFTSNKRLENRDNLYLIWDEANSYWLEIGHTDF